METTQDQEVEQPSRPALPLVALLALASALGIAVAVVLASVAMLLAAPAYADERPRWLEPDDAVMEQELIAPDCESVEDGETLVLVCAFRLPAHGVLEQLRFVEGATGSRPEGTLVVELEYRLAPRDRGARLLTMR